MHLFMLFDHKLTAGKRVANHQDYRNFTVNMSLEIEINFC